MSIFKLKRRKRSKKTISAKTDYIILVVSKKEIHVGNDVEHLGSFTWKDTKDICQCLKVVFSRIDCTPKCTLVCTRFGACQNLEVLLHCLPKHIQKTALFMNVSCTRVGTIVYIQQNISSGSINYQ